MTKLYGLRSQGRGHSCPLPCQLVVGEGKKRNIICTATSLLGKNLKVVWGSSRNFWNLSGDP